MKNVVDKIITVLSGISVKRNQIQQALQTVIMTNQQYQAVNTLCDQISAKYFMVKDPLSDITYLFKCYVGSDLYEGSQLDIQEDIIVWDKVIPNNSTQYTITVMSEYYGSADYKWAYGIKQNQNIILDLYKYNLNFLSIYNKGWLIINSSADYEYTGMIKQGDYIINEGTLRINGGILDSIKNIDNKGSLNCTAGQIRNSNIICSSGSIFSMTGGSINSFSLTIQNIKEFIIAGGYFLGGILIFNNGNQINHISGGQFIDSEFVIESNLKIYVYQNEQQNYRNIQNGIFKVKQTGNLIIEYHGGRLQNTNIMIQLYGNRNYDYRQMVVKAPDMDEEYFQQMYSQGWCNVYAIYCYQGATIDNYDGYIQYR